VFAKYKTLLSSDNYVTKRMSLKLLGEILLDRTNFNVMWVCRSSIHRESERERERMRRPPRLFLLDQGGCVCV
jgi:hypothetical protein